MKMETQWSLYNIMKMGTRGPYFHITPGPGQLLKICPGDSGTVGAYVKLILHRMILISVVNMMYLHL